MESKEPARFTSIQPVLDDLLPIVRSFAVGRYAVAISGSYGKGTPDSRADIDLRLYADELSAPFAAMGEAIRPIKEAWIQKGSGQLAGRETAGDSPSVDGVGLPVVT